MGTIHKIRDNLVNFVTGLGTIKDPTTSAQHVMPLLTKAELDTTYRSNWLAKRIVNAPAEDATREWRLWQTDQENLEAIEEVEKVFKIQQKVKQTIIRSRLYGGAALILGVEQGKSDEPLDLEKVGEGDLKFVVGVNMYDLSPGTVILDPLSPWYGRPEYYAITSRLQNAELSGVTLIHPSRVIPFTGHEIPDPTIAPQSFEWGDSVLTDVDDIIKDFGMVVGGLASMVNDAKMDVIKIPDFSKQLATDEYTQRLLKRFTFANTSKSTINSLLLDSEEEWNRIQTSFSGLPNLLSEFLRVTSGAAGIPVSRLMGQAPAKGLSSTSGGEQDMMNYYDTVAALQKTVYGPALEQLDYVVVASATGSHDPSIYYKWAPLYQPDPMQAADVALKKAQTTTAYVSMGLINTDVLRDISINQLIEDGTYPGIEDAVEEYGAEPEEPEPGDANWQPTVDPKTGQPIEQPPAAPQQIGDYDPNQPRDDHGRWVDVDGADSEGARKLKNGKPVPSHIPRIPPAWTDVKISKDPDSHLLVTGFDAKGRRVAIYSASHAAKQAQAKFARTEELTKKFDSIRAQNEKLRKSEDPRVRDAADATRLIMDTGIRPGSDADTKAAVKAYGATTLEGRHVVDTKEGTRLQFTGKKGVAIDIPITDLGTAKMIRDRAKAAGRNGKLFPNTDARALLDHVHAFDGGGFKTKDFRTMVANKVAMQEVAKMPKPKSEKEYKKAVAAVARTVSDTLGNTPTVALQSYINPVVFAGWRIK